MSNDSTGPFEAVQEFGLLPAWTVKGPGIIGSYGRWRSESDAWECAVLLNDIYALGADGKDDAMRAVKALLRELKGLRPGLDRAHDHHGVQREKVDAAIRLGELALGVPGAEPPVGLSAVSPGKAPEDAASPRCISGPHAESAEQIRQQYERGIQEGDTVMEAKPIDAPEHFMAVADGHRIRIPVRDNNMLGEVILCDHITELPVAKKMLERLQAAIRTVEKGIAAPPPPPPGRIIHEGKVPPQP